MVRRAITNRQMNTPNSVSPVVTASPMKRCDRHAPAAGGKRVIHLVSTPFTGVDTGAKIYLNLACLHLVVLC